MFSSVGAVVGVSVGISVGIKEHEMKQKGNSMDDPEKRLFVRLSAQEHRLVRIAAAKQGVSMSEWARKAILDGLRAEKG